MYKQMMFVLTTVLPIMFWTLASAKSIPKMNTSVLDDFKIAYDISIPLAGEETSNNGSIMLIGSQLFIVVTTLGLLANLVVFFVIFCGDGITKTTTTLYVLQLTIADSAFLVALPFLAIQNQNREWYYGGVTCTICQTLKFFNYYAGVFFLTAMSVDRYIAVAYSTRAHKLRTKSRALISSALVWLASALASLPAMFYSTIEELHVSKLCRVNFPGYNSFDENDYILKFEDINSIDELLNHSNFSDYDDNMVNTNRCRFMNEPLGFYIVEITKLIAGFVFPLCIISVSYFCITQQLQKSEQRLQSSGSGNRTQTTRRRVTLLVSALVICFAVCWLPYHIFVLLKFQGFDASPNVCMGIEYFVVILGYSNSVFNPILYTFLGHNFRERFWKSLEKARRRLTSQSRYIGSRSLTVTKRSTYRKSQPSSKQATRNRHSQEGHVSRRISTGCAGDCATVLTENQLARDGKKISALDLIKNVERCGLDSTDEKTPCIGRA